MRLYQNPSSGFQNRLNPVTATKTSSLSFAATWPPSSPNKKELTPAKFPPSAPASPQSSPVHRSKRPTNAGGKRESLDECPTTVKSATPSNESHRRIGSQPVRLYSTPGSTSTLKIHVGPVMTTTTPLSSFGDCAGRLQHVPPALRGLNDCCIQFPFRAWLRCRSTSSTTDPVSKFL